MDCFIQIKAMEPKEPDGNNDADWRPPKAPGKNVRCGDDLYLRHLRGSTGMVSRHATRNLEELGTFSLYHDSDKMWTVDYDVTVHKVGDGDDNSSGSSSDSDDSAANEATQKRDWTELRFKRPNISNTRSLTFVTHDGEHGRILYQHPMHRGIEKVLPDKYCKVLADMDSSSDPSQGGLVGELPLLLGLLVFAMTPQEVPQLLPQSLGSMPWALPHPDRRVGRTDKRGVVVTVWAGQGQSLQSLRAIEQGIHGPVFL